MHLNIGLLEDDHVVADVLGGLFEAEQWAYERFETISALRAALPRSDFNLLVLDWSVPDGTAETLIPWVRARFGWDLPILIESVLGDEAQIVRALGLGADDYVVKPLRVLEVKARIESLLRRAHKQGDQELVCGPFRIDLAQRRLTLDGEPVELTRVELDLMAYFLQHPGELLSRQRLLEAVWKISGKPDTRTVDSHVCRLRKKLQLGPQRGVQLLGLHGYGYRLEALAPSEHAD